MDSPKLIESSTQNYLYNVLQKCHNNRIYLYSYVWNISIVVIFVVIAGITLYLCAKRKKNPDEQEKQLLNEQYYILEKIKEFKDHEKYMKSMNTITTLPITG
jgi:flagellar biosynthesis/type III secretory pathway M-ring protein FliF/YscJ